MKLEDQVCSLELAKRLKELGVKQDSLYAYFRKRDYGQDPEWELNINDGIFDDDFAALTLADLGEILPYRIDYFDFEYIKSIHEKEGIIHTIIYCGNCETLHIEEDSKEADARAKMLIYLLEKGLMK